MLGRKKQLEIGAILFLIACIAGYLTAYNFGLDELRTRRDSVLTVRAYDVSDLLTPTMGSATIETNLANLKLLIESTTNGDWDRRQFTVQAFPANKLLVIQQTGAIHDKIREPLADVRGLTQNRR